MTSTTPSRAATTPLSLGRRAGWAAWFAPGLLVAGLALAVALRWWATRAGLDALAVGAAFGLGLAAVVAAERLERGSPMPDIRDRLTGPWIASARVARGRPAPRFRAVVVGSLVGFALIGVAVAGPILTGTPTVPGLGRPAAPFLPWAAITILVATAEEALLRGALFDRLGRLSPGRLGLGLAVGLTSIVFAGMHVPLYGWHVVPLDLAVGCCLGGLRIATRSVAAPAAAHAVADLGTWWL